MKSRLSVEWKGHVIPITSSVMKAGSRRGKKYKRNVFL